MKKYLDILLFSLLFALLFSYFSGNTKQTPQTGIVFQATQQSYKVPAGIVLNLTNNTAETLSFDICQDLSIRYNGEIISLPSEACASQTLDPTQIKSIDMGPYYSQFSTPGEYVFELKIGEKEFLQTVEVEYRGTIGKIFVGLFYAPMYNLLAYLIHIFSNSLGYAILAITIIIRVILLFPQHKMLVSQRKMQAIQPKIKALQEKYKGKQQELGLELMKLYKEEGVNPLGSCGFLLIQMPFLLVIYNIIVNITSLKNEFYLYDFLPEFHITQINPVFLGMNLLEAGGLTGLILALGVALVQYIQVKLSLHTQSTTKNEAGVVLEKKKDASDYTSFMPDPEMLNKFMLYGMPVMVGIFTYTLIAGVGLYWGMSTLFAIFQQLFVNKIIKK